MLLRDGALAQEGNVEEGEHHELLRVLGGRYLHGQHVDREVF